MGKSVIIIGAGIGGLSAGCYGQMNGYRTTIFEMHDKPGGLCTAWERQGYTIDGCLHWLVGSAPGTSLHTIWQELGALQGQQIIDPEEFCRFEDVTGKAFTAYANIDRLEAHMKEIAPEDSQIISECTRAMRRFARMDIPSDKAPELYSAIDGLKLTIKMLPYLGAMRKWGKLTMAEFAQRFKNPLLREAWKQMWTPEFSSVFMIMTFSHMHNRQAGYVIGGSMKLSRSIEKRYLDLGGEIKYKSRVSKILVENDRAVGVKLADGSEHRADYVISAADGYATIFEMLSGKYIDNKIKGYYEKMPIFQPLIYVGLGVNRSFEGQSKQLSITAYELQKAVVIAGKTREWMSLRFHNFDPTLAPTGKTVITAMFETNYAYWEELRKDMARYRAEKEQIAEAVISLLDQRYPGLRAQVEMQDVATPVTFKRYTGNWQGSYEGWLMTPQNIVLNVKKTLPGLDCFYMAGQWVQPGGGLPSGAMTGRYVIQFLCKRDKKQFVTTTL